MEGTFGGGRILRQFLNDIEGELAEFAFASGGVVHGDAHLAQRGGRFASGSGGIFECLREIPRRTFERLDGYARNRCFGGKLRCLIDREAEPRSEVLETFGCFALALDEIEHALRYCANNNDRD